MDNLNYTFKWVLESAKWCKTEWQSLSNRQFGYRCLFSNHISTEQIDYFKVFANLAKKLQILEKKKNKKPPNSSRKLVELVEQKISIPLILISTF